MATHVDRLGLLGLGSNVGERRANLQAAVDAPRVHCQGDDTFVDARIPGNVHDALTTLGHRVVTQRDSPGVNCFGRVAAVSVDTAGALHAASWPPWQTAAAGW